MYLKPLKQVFKNYNLNELDKQLTLLFLTGLDENANTRRFWLNVFIPVSSQLGSCGVSDKKSFFLRHQGFLADVA